LWQQGNLEVDLKQLAKSAANDDAAFCNLCGHVQRWFHLRNQELRAMDEPPLPKSVLGLRSSESYDDPADVNRIATIYAGLAGKAIFVPFRKGDPSGNRWLDNEPLFIEWTQDVAKFMFSNSGRKAPNMPVIRNAHLYFTPGITWSAVGNHVAVKARYQEPCAFDADSMRLTPMTKTIDPLAFLAVFNSDIFSFLKMKFVKHTAKWEIGDMRQIPIVLPTPAQEAELSALARQCMAMKRASYAGASLAQDQVAEVRAWSKRLQQDAPDYLRPPAQMNLAVSPEDCLTILERAASWRAEVLYGVEGEGPFDEF
jgi:hypothetical protein